MQRSAQRQHFVVEVVARVVQRDGVPPAVALPDADEDFDDVPDSVTAPAAAVPTGADADDALNGVV